VKSEHVSLIIDLSRDRGIANSWIRYDEYFLLSKKCKV